MSCECLPRLPAAGGPDAGFHDVESGGGTSGSDGRVSPIRRRWPKPKPKAKPTVLDRRQWKLSGVKEVSQPAMWLLSQLASDCLPGKSEWQFVGPVLKSVLAASRCGRRTRMMTGTTTGRGGTSSSGSIAWRRTDGASCGRSGSNAMSSCGRLWMTSGVRMMVPGTGLLWGSHLRL
jgi:hypothetical protein